MMRCPDCASEFTKEEAREEIIALIKFLKWKLKYHQEALKELEDC